MAESDDLILWLDMEMTGLDFEVCVPLEVACIVTDAKFEERGTFETVIHQPEAALATMIEFVRNMHTENGLLKRVEEADTDLATADKKTAAFVAKHFPKGKAVLAGNSIYNDRIFIRRYFPETEKLLHYRMIDVSSIKEIARRWYGDRILMDKSGAHTAMADIRESIAELHHYRKTLFVEAL